MPYIKKDRRYVLAGIQDPEPLDNDYATGPGELNYLVTIVVNNYLQRNGLSYQTINDIVGALDGAKMEFYRRIAIPYENKKIKENGDVYGEV